MLQFYYDFLDKYLDHSDFQMCEMDTDSAYIAISGDSVESLVTPELRGQFEQDKFAPTRLNIRRMIREPQDCLKSSGKGKALSGCLQKPIIVLGPKINLVAKE